MSALPGKVAVATGADSDIGLAAAKAFARQGAPVVVTGRRRAALRREPSGRILASPSTPSCGTASIPGELK